ncbi:MAG: prolyl oligopeptidase family serine peptidase [Planctomycetes bacterium]|nr:prolyl oligopeptidase family serine peptidase [Planctomycetota bacterium]
MSTLLPYFDEAFSADNRDRFEAREFQSPDGGRLLYRLLRPTGDPPQNGKYPLVLLLHGAGERGDDNRRQLVHGANELASDTIMARYPCFVVVPQCPDGQQWVDTPWSADAHTTPEKATRPMRWTLELIDKLEKELPVDPQRIYVTGLSMGGFGAWDAMVRQPDRFAAAVVICGGGDTSAAAKIAHIPVWVFHGDQDGAVKTQRSRDMVQALKKAGGSPKYTEYPGIGHDSWTATYRNPEMYAWLFAQRKAPNGPSRP